MKRQRIFSFAGRRKCLLLSLGGIALLSQLPRCSAAAAVEPKQTTSQETGAAGKTSTSGADTAETAGADAQQERTQTGQAKQNSVPDYVLSYADNQTGNYPTVQAARRFAEQVNQETDGRIEIRVYPNAELGDEVSTVKQLIFGGIDLCRSSLSSLAEYSAESIVLQMPYLYEDRDHMWRVLDGEVGNQVKDSFQGTGLVPLAWFDAGVRNFYTVEKPIDTLEDMQGLRIRIVPNSPLMEDMVRQLGAEPVPIVYEAVKDAIQTGEIDGAENNWSSYEAMDHDEVAPYFMLDEHTRVPELMLASSSTWEQLSPEDQATIQRCADAAGLYERELWTARERSAREKCLREGTVEIVLPEREKKRFRDAVSPLYKKYCGDYAELVEKINEIRD